MKRMVKPAYSILMDEEEMECQHGSGKMAIKIKFMDSGKTYLVNLYEPETALKEMKSNASGFVGKTGFVLVDEASIPKIQEIAGELVESGFFDSLVPLKDK